MTAAKPEAAAMPSAQRGPYTSATQPTMGAPIGVQPKATARRIAITRPLMAGSVDNCIKLFVELAKVSADTPMTTRARPNSQYVGASAAIVQPKPKKAAPIHSRDILGLGRRAARRAPVTDPT